MKKITLLFLLIISQVVNAQNLKEYRTLLVEGEDSERAAKMLMDKSLTAFNTTKKPIFAGFLAVGNFFMAKHVFNPLKKMSYFKEGKNSLEYAVKSDPQNIELRVMRLMSQENMPKILGYSQNIAEDRQFLKKEYLKTDDEDLKSHIKDYLKL